MQREKQGASYGFETPLSWGPNGQQKVEEKKTLRIINASFGPVASQNSGQRCRPKTALAGAYPGSQRKSSSTAPSQTQPYSIVPVTFFERSKSNLTSPPRSFSRAGSPTSPSSPSSPSSRGKQRIPIKIPQSVTNRPPSSPGIRSFQHTKGHHTTIANVRWATTVVVSPRLALGDEPQVHKTSSEGVVPDEILPWDMMSDTARSASLVSIQSERTPYPVVPMNVPVMTESVPVMSQVTQ